MTLFKAFSLRCKCSDPRPLNIRIETNVYFIKEGKLLKADLLNEDAFSSSDIVELENRLTPLKLSYNDVVHGDYEIKVLYFQVPESTEVVEVISFEEVDRNIRENYISIWSKGKRKLMNKVVPKEIDKRNLLRMLGLKGID